MLHTWVNHWEDCSEPSPLQKSYQYSWPKVKFYKLLVCVISDKFGSQNMIPSISDQLFLYFTLYQYLKVNPSLLTFLTSHRLLNFFFFTIESQWGTQIQRCSRFSGVQCTSTHPFTIVNFPAPVYPVFLLTLFLPRRHSVLNFIYFHFKHYGYWKVILA